MTTPTFISCPNSAALRATIAPWLAVDPVPSALVCGIAELAERTGWSGVVTVAGKPVLAMTQTPPRSVVIATPQSVDPHVVAAVVDVFRAGNRVVRGINGPEPWAAAIAERCSATYRVSERIRLHRLNGIPRLPQPTDGVARLFRSDEVPLLRQWMQDFLLEAIQPDNRGPAPTVADAQAKRPHFLAWTVNDTPVAMAQIARPLLGGSTLSYVYTPPALRGRGYGGAVTHAISAQLLAQGSTYVALYTDLANPISNRLYARIGFVPVLDQTLLTWGES